MKIKTKIKNLWNCLLDGIDDGFRRLCYGVSPVGRFIIALTLYILLRVAYLYFIVSSLYTIGKQDAEKELFKLQHIQKPDLPRENDSINYLHQKGYEYECEK
jgi:hypothetical protein